PSDPQSVHPQRVRTASARVRNTQHRPHFPAYVPAVLVCNSCRLINYNSQHARLASTAQLHFHHLQPAGGSDALRNLAHPLGLKCHVTSNLQYALGKLLVTRSEEHTSELQSR